ncbi:CAPA peptides [Bacillus rossius redtenbacheri]|uniref:CAPA peptides n=1 Tax=Bacillus rossius redtenbacheri TaxID=93214 RepID=UPI002FDCBA2C
MTGGALVYLVLLTFAVKGDRGGVVVQRKERQVSGLMPFPRVGRSGGDVSWTLDSPELQEAKRQGLMAFPRVGRSRGYLVLRPDGGRRDTAGDAGGMWFGPRLGRRDRRSAEEPRQPWALVALREYPSQRRHDGYYHRVEAGSPEDEEESSADEDMAGEGAGRTFRDQPASS